MLTKLAKKLNESANENSKEDTDVRSDGRTETTVDRDKVDSAASKKRQDRTKFLRKKYHRMEASSNLELENGQIDPLLLLDDEYYDNEPDQAHFDKTLA